MIYHPLENKVTKFIKIVAFWASMLAMLWLVILIFHDDVQVPQHEITVRIDMKDRVNICVPEEGVELDE